MGTFDDLDRRYDARYVRIDSQEYQVLVKDVDEAKKSSWRTERYLVGGLNDNGKYTLGLVPIVTIIGIVVVAILVPVLIHAITHWTGT